MDYLIVAVALGVPLLFLIMKRTGVGACPEARECLAELRSAEAELRDFAPGDLFDEVRKQLSNTERVIEVVRVKKTPPRHLVWLLIANVARQQLASGYHHVYRGMLDMKGEAFERVLDHALNALERGGYIPPAKIAQLRAVVRKEIAEVG